MGIAINNTQPMISDKVVINEQHFWNKSFCDFSERVIIPYDNFDVLNDCKFKEIDFELEEECSKRLISMSSNSDLALQIILNAFVLTLLQKYTSSSDLVLGTTIDIQDAEGEFINTILPLRIRFESSISFKNLILECKNTILDCKKNQNYPIESLLYELKLKHSSYYFPLFDVGTILKNIQDESYFKDVNPGILFIFNRKDSSIHVRIKYNSNLYNESKIILVKENVESLMSNLLSDLNVPLSQISLFSKKRESVLLNEYSNGVDLMLECDTIHFLFESKVKSNPDKIALIYEDKYLTYSDLNVKANIIAKQLQANGLEKGEIVGLILNRSVEMVIGMLAVMKAGGAYLPIDIEAPINRKIMMLNDCSVKLLLSNINNDINLQDNYNIINLNNIESLANQDTNDFVSIYDPKEVAYVIYTSGSTGKPKGVIINHQSIVNQLCWRRDYFGLCVNDNIIQVFSYYFDGSVTDIFASLISGSKLVIVPSEHRYNYKSIDLMIRKHCISYFLMVPQLYKAYLNNIDETPRSLKKVSIAGDKVTPELVNLHFNKLKDIKLYNEYGPTENSVGTTIFHITGSQILIGEETYNSRCYICNEDLNILPFGFPGEIIISGKGIARGYLNQPELTSSKFIKNEKFEDVAYKTGDLAIRTTQGMLDFIGRKDYQVKIRGIRIELGEIESLLAKHPSIKESVLVAKDDNNDKKLTAYIIANKVLAVEQLREYLLESLPEYMVPYNFVFLDKMPLSSIGKVDIKELQKLNLNDDQLIVRPQSKIDEKLVSIWSELLNIDYDKISIDKSFFEYGGNSLNSVTLISKIHNDFNVEIKLVDFFKNQTIKKLSEMIEALSVNFDEIIVEQNNNKKITI